jgi:hypothetical protein
MDHESLSREAFFISEIPVFWLFVGLSHGQRAVFSSLRPRTSANSVNDPSLMLLNIIKNIYIRTYILVVQFLQSYKEFGLSSCEVTKRSFKEVLSFGQTQLLNRLGTDLTENQIFQSSQITQNSSLRRGRVSRIRFPCLNGEFLHKRIPNFIMIFQGKVQ